MSHVSRPVAGTLLLLVPLGLGCTDVELCAMPCTPPDPPVFDNVVSVEGQACTVDPQAVIFPYKILFVIDQSTSNQTSDPDDNRALAVQRVIDQYVENRAVSFGVIGFSEYAERTTAGFTRDYGVLIPGVVDTLKREISSTNYLDTLDLVYEYIEEDAENTPEAERARTRYDIQWLSDGIPDPCQRPEPILQRTQEILDLKEQFGFFDIRLNTIRLFHPGYDVENCTDLIPDDYLGPMAELGNGTFQVLDSEEVDFQIEFTEIFRRLESRKFFLVNENRVAWNDEILPDSDGDGIRDLDEGNEPDPRVADHNQDGCTDRVDQELLPNVGVCADYCTAEMQATDSNVLADRDADGLPDCAEQTLGYHRLSSDSDRDGFSDLLELKFATNPLDARTISQDTDGDGRMDADEIRGGTNPLVPEASDEFVYEYSPLTPIESENVGTSCFDFNVQNVQLVHTMATELSVEGENYLCLYLVQTPIDDPNAEPLVTKACKSARYLRFEDFDIKEPAAGRLVFEPQDFEPTACAGRCQALAPSEAGSP